MCVCVWVAVCRFSCVGAGLRVLLVRFCGFCVFRGFGRGAGLCFGSRSFGGFWCACVCGFPSGRGLALWRFRWYSVCVVWLGCRGGGSGLRASVCFVVVLGVCSLSRVRSSVSRGVACGDLLLPGFSWAPVLVPVAGSVCRRRVGSVPVASSVLFLPGSVPSRVVAGSLVVPGFASSRFVRGGRVRSGLAAGLGLAVLSWSVASPLAAVSAWWRPFVRSAGLLSSVVAGWCGRRGSGGSGGSGGSWRPVFRPAGSGLAPAVSSAVPALAAAASSVRGGLRPGVRSAVVSSFAGSVLLLSAPVFGAAVSRGGCPVVLAVRAFQRFPARSAVFRALCCAVASGALRRFLVSGAPGSSSLSAAVSAFVARARALLGFPTSAGLRSLAAPVLSAAASGSLPALSFSPSAVSSWAPVAWIGVFRRLTSCCVWLSGRFRRGWACAPWLALLLLWLGRS